MNTLFKEIYIIQLSKQEHFWLCLFFHAKGFNVALNEHQITLCMIVLVRDPKVKWSVLPDSVIATVAGVICEFVADVASICITARSCG